MAMLAILYTPSPELTLYLIVQQLYSSGTNVLGLIIYCNIGKYVLCMYVYWILFENATELGGHKA